MSPLKPIKLYSHELGPNPLKVIILLDELNIPYESENVDMKTIHEKPFTNISLNGRVPAIVDPNTGLTLWESCACLEYLQATYDKEGRMVVEGLDAFLMKQWLYFQPYFGQATWFDHYAPEKVDFAIQRYRNEALRVLGVLDEHLKGKTYLVGEKYTIADISFLPWDWALHRVLGEENYAAHELDKKYPNWSAWHKRLNEKPVIKKVLAYRDAQWAALRAAKK